MLAARRRAGRSTRFSRHLGELDTFPAAAGRGASTATTAAGPSRARRWTSRCARRDARWPRSSAASRDPITFVVSSRMGEPPRSTAVARKLARYPELRFKLDATPDWTDELIARAGRVRRGRLVRLQGRLQGHASSTRHRPRLLPPDRRDVPGRLARGPGLDDETRAGARAVRGPDHLGRADPLDRRHPRRAGAAAHGQPQAVAVRQHAGAVRRLRLLRGARDGRLRRRPVRARRGPRPDPVPGRALPPRRAERHRPGRLRRADPEPGLPGARCPPARADAGFLALG